MSGASDKAVTAALVGVAAACWLALLLGEGGLAAFPICGSARLDLGSLAPDGVMLVAMMAPLTISPLLHVRARAFASRRARSSALFLFAYALVWCAAGAAILALTQTLRSGLVALVVAAVWQVSPAKQWMLNRCHNRRALVAVGRAADADAFAYGLQQGAACVGACALLMAAPMALDRWQMPVMALVSLLLWLERFDRAGPLTWAPRPSGKAARALCAAISSGGAVPFSNAWGAALGGLREFVIGLQRHPEARGADIGRFKAQRQFRADARAAIQDPR